MSAALPDRRQAVLDLEPRLLDWAGALTHDLAEARALVSETLMIAGQEDYGAGESIDARTWVFRLLRQRYYSLERLRENRRARSAFAVDLAFTRKRALLAQAALDEAAPAAGLT